MNWLPWNEDTLARARDEDKPIFLTVGYSTCYWCHVMERESFRDPFVARHLNEDFICIRVDREEQPEVDEIYMAATQIYSHGGGWPNNVFLTPELQPYFCGTYFPAEERGPEHPSFRTVVESMAHAWEERRAEVQEQAAELHHVMTRYLTERGERDKLPPADLAQRPLESLRKAFDAEHGGFLQGQGSKFPLAAHLLYLEGLDATEMLDTTLRHMMRGGIRDQLGGGFHRHTTDRAWRVPHFEKLLCDNALLLELYARAFERTQDPELGYCVRQTVTFLQRELGTDDGAFGSAVDAVSDGAPEHRPHHVWTLRDLVDVLGEEDAAFLAPLFGFDGEPFFEGDGYVLHLPASLTSQAERRGMTLEQLDAEVEPLRRKLFEARERRPRPRRDLKVMTDWNGLAIAGLAEAGRVLHDADLVQRAARAADVVLAELRSDNGLRHVLRDGEARGPGLVWDYVFLVRGLLALVDAGEERFLKNAVDLVAEQRERLADGRGGFYTATERPDLVCRSREVFDTALPSANGVAALNLLALHERTGDDAFRREAEGVLRAFAGVVRDSESARTLAFAVHRYHQPTH